MPIFFKLLLRSCFEGIAVGWVFLAILVLGNFSQLGDRIFASSSPFLALFLLAFGFAITFGSVSMGIAIMSIPHDDIEFEDDNTDPDYEFPY